MLAHDARQADDGGKGSIDVNKDGTTIEGKNGKSVTLPGVPR